MAIRHVVKQGECLSLIAALYHQDWKTLWNDPLNADLRQQRKSPNILYPGDIVWIPEPEAKTVLGEMDRRHHFVLARGRAQVRIRMLNNGIPIANEPYRFTEDLGNPREGRTNGDGLVEQNISPLAQEVTIEFPQRNERYKFRLGALDPVDTATGMQARLQQLGFYSGRIDGIVGPLTEGAIQSFLETFLTEKASPDDDSFLDTLVQQYGS